MHDVVGCLFRKAFNYSATSHYVLYHAADVVGGDECNHGDDDDDDDDDDDVDDDDDGSD